MDGGGSAAVSPTGDDTESKSEVDVEEFHDRLRKVYAMEEKWLQIIEQTCGASELFKRVSDEFDQLKEDFAQIRTVSEQDLNESLQMFRNLAAETNDKLRERGVGSECFIKL